MKNISSLQQQHDWLTPRRERLACDQALPIRAHYPAPHNQVDSQQLSLVARFLRATVDPDPPAVFATQVIDDGFIHFIATHAHRT